MELVGTVVRRHGVVPSIELEARAGDAIGETADENAEKGAILYVLCEVREPQHQLAAHATGGHTEAPENSTVREYLGLEAVGAAERESSHALPVFEPSELPHHVRPRFASKRR